MAVDWSGFKILDRKMSWGPIWRAFIQAVEDAVNLLFTGKAASDHVHGPGEGDTSIVSRGGSGDRLAAGEVSMHLNDVNGNTERVDGAGEVEDVYLMGGVMTRKWSAGAFIPSVTDGAAIVSKEVGSTHKKTVDVAVFPDGTTKTIELEWEPPTNWDLGPVMFKFKHTGAPGCSIGDAVEYRIKGVAFKDGDDWDEEWGTAVVISDVVLNADGPHRTGLTPPLTIANTPAAGDTIRLMVDRSFDGTDDMTQEGWLIVVEMEYGIDKSKQVSGD